MNLNGKAPRFVFNVGAAAIIAKACPGGDLSKLGKLIADKDLSKQIDTIALLARAMSRYSGGDQIEDEDVYSLSFGELEELQNELLEAFASGAQTEVLITTKKKVREQSPSRG